VRRADIWRRPQQFKVRRVISDGRLGAEPFAACVCCWLSSLLGRAMGDFSMMQSRDVVFGWRLCHVLNGMDNGEMRRLAELLVEA
jgi:hypothetical protein